MSENTLLVRPGAGQNIILQTDPAVRLKFAFDQADASFNKEGQDLVLNFEDGGTITLQDFCDHFGDNAHTSFVIDACADSAFIGHEVDSLEIFGASGNDIIHNGGGSKILYGDADDDIFAYKLADMAGGTDIIKDFHHDFANHTGDVLRLDDMIRSGDEMQNWLKSANWAVIKDDDIIRSINYGNPNTNAQLKLELGIDFAELTARRESACQQTIIILQSRDFTKLAYDETLAQQQCQDIIKITG